MEEKKKIGLLGTIFLGAGVCLSYYLVFFMGSLHPFGQAHEKAFQLDALRDHVVDNQIPFQFAYWKDDNPWILPLDEFELFIQANYEYSLDYKDCKYWSLVWSAYSQWNQIDYEFLTTPNHIAVQMNFEDGYCIADLNDLHCMRQSTNENGKKIQ